MSYITSSIGKKQIVAVTGLALILFIIGHLAGNFIIYLGPEAFNNYADKLKKLRPALNVAEAILLVTFIVHIYVTLLLVLQNRAARPQNYSEFRPRTQRSWATRLSTYTGLTIFSFVIWHLFDFTFVNHAGPRGVLPDGNNYGLFGVVYNSFANPYNSAFYILAMAALSYHLAHGVESAMQTFGRNNETIKKISNGFALLMFLGYSSIPVAVYFGCVKYSPMFCPFK